MRPNRWQSLVFASCLCLCALWASEVRARQDRASWQLWRRMAMGDLSRPLTVVASRHWVIYGAPNYTLRVYDYRRHRDRVRLVGLAQAPRYVFALNDNIVLASSLSGEIGMWNLAAVDDVDEQVDLYPMYITQDAHQGSIDHLEVFQCGTKGLFLASVGGSRGDGYLKIWSLARQRGNAFLKPVTEHALHHPSGAKSVAWSSFGKLLLTGGKDGRIVALETCKRGHTVGERPLWQASFSSSEYVMSIGSYTVAGRLLIWALGNNAVRVYDAAKGRELWSCTVPYQQRWLNVGRHLLVMDRHYLLFGGDAGQLWLMPLYEPSQPNMPSEVQTTNCPVRLLFDRPSGSYLRSIAVSSEGSNSWTVFAGFGNDQVFALRLEYADQHFSVTETRLLDSWVDAPRMVALGSKARLLAVGTTRGRFYCFDLSAGGRYWWGAGSGGQDLVYVGFIARPGVAEQNLAVVTTRGKVGIFYDCLGASRYPKYQAKPVGGWQSLERCMHFIRRTCVLTVAVANEELVVGYTDGVIETYAIKLTESGVNLERLRCATISPDAPLRIGVPRGQRSASELDVWVRGQESIYRLRISPVTRVRKNPRVCNPSRATLAVLDELPILDPWGAFAVYQSEEIFAFGAGKVGIVEDRRRRHTLLRSRKWGHWNWITDLVIVDDQHLITTGGDGQVLAWSLGEGVEASRLASHSNWVVDVDLVKTYFPDRAVFATASWDGTVNVYVVEDLSKHDAAPSGTKTKTLVPVLTLSFFDPGAWLMVSSHNHHNTGIVGDPEHGCRVRRVHRDRLWSLAEVNVAGRLFRPFDMCMTNAELVGRLYRSRLQEPGSVSKLPKRDVPEPPRIVSFSVHAYGLPDSGVKIIDNGRLLRQRVVLEPGEVSLWGRVAEAIPVQGSPEVTAVEIRIDGRVVAQCPVTSRRGESSGVTCGIDRYDMRQQHEYSVEILAFGELHTLSRADFSIKTRMRVDLDVYDPEGVWFDRRAVRSPANEDGSVILKEDLTRSLASEGRPERHLLVVHGNVALSQAFYAHNLSKNYNYLFSFPDPTGNAAGYWSVWGKNIEPDWALWKDVYNAFLRGLLVVCEEVGNCSNDYSNYDRVAAAVSQATMPYGGFHRWLVQSARGLVRENTLWMERYERFWEVFFPRGWIQVFAGQTKRHPSRRPRRTVDESRRIGMIASVSVYPEEAGLPRIEGVRWARRALRTLWHTEGIEVVAQLADEEVTVDALETSLWRALESLPPGGEMWIYLGGHGRGRWYLTGSYRGRGYQGALWVPALIDVLCSEAVQRRVWIAVLLDACELGGCFQENELLQSCRSGQQGGVAVISASSSLAYSKERTLLAAALVDLVAGWGLVELAEPGNGSPVESNSSDVWRGAMNDGQLAWGALSRLLERYTKHLARKWGVTQVPVSCVYSRTGTVPPKVLRLSLTPWLRRETRIGYEHQGGR